MFNWLKKRKRKKLIEWKNSKPDFDIIEFQDIHPFNLNEKCDINLLFVKVEHYVPHEKRFAYQKGFRNPENWVCVKYTLKNVGHTKIEKLILALNSCKYHSIFSIYETVPEKGINFTVTHNQSISPAEILTIQICYLKDYILEEPVSLSFYFVDSNKNWWEQPFSPPYEAIGETSFTNMKMFLAYTDENKLINECYIKPLTYSHHKI